MRSVGLIGGMSWHSTLEYYRRINQAVNARHGDNTNPPLLLDNLDQHEIHRLQGLGRWDGIEAMLLRSGSRLQAAGVEAVLLCANTPHKVYPGLAAGLRIPVLHIADATGAAIRAQGLDRVGLLGTRHVLEGGYIADWLGSRYGIEVVVPAPAAIAALHAIIVGELSMGTLSGESRSFLLAQAGELRRRGAQGVVLGCTELPLVMGGEDCGVPSFDTTRLHADMAVEFIMSNG